MMVNKIFFKIVAPFIKAAGYIASSMFALQKGFSKKHN